MASDHFVLLSFGVIILAVQAHHVQDQSFWWRSCGNSTDPIQISTLSVYQNSSEYIYVTMEGKIVADLKSPIQATLRLKKKLEWFWVDIPCNIKLLTCYYDDICSLSPYENVCPEFYKDHNLPCHCPLLQGQYSVKNLPVSLDYLPHWMETGTYSLKVELKRDQQVLVCLKMTADIK